MLTTLTMMCSIAIINNTVLQQLDQLLEVVVHEAIHVLFFSDNLYRLFIDPETNAHLPLSEVVREIEPYNPPWQQRPRHLIVLPQVAAAARSHFSCPFVMGAELSNDGANNSNVYRASLSSFPSP